MAQSNYDKTRDAMRVQFLQYDQNAMIGRFSLRADDAYLYLPFLGGMCRVGRKDGVVEWSDDGLRAYTEADYMLSLTLYDVLCCAKPDCRLTGQYVTERSLPGVVYTGHTAAYAPTGGGETLAALFDRAPDRLEAACQTLGGAPYGRGDVAYRVPLFEFLPVVFQFWRADEDFPASITLLWDAATLDFMKYETMCYAEILFLNRLRQLAQL